MAGGHGGPRENSGGRREGAGRPSGSGWRPAVTELRAAAAEKLATVIGSASDPLSVVIDAACNQELDMATRLGAASIALPYLYPRLSATQVSATVTTIKTDHGAVLDRLAERIERLVGPPAIDGEVSEADKAVIEVVDPPAEAAA